MCIYYWSGSVVAFDPQRTAIPFTHEWFFFREANAWGERLI